MIERRFVKDAEVRFRARSDSEKGSHIEGHAAVFNQEYVLWDGGSVRVVETIKPGAFTRALKEKQDVRCLFNHEPDNLLGRTAAGTLALSQDKAGLFYSCELPETQMARDVATLVQRGDISGCSFGFTVTKQTTREEKKDKITLYTREIEDVDLFDASPVTYPAYEGTDVTARSRALQRELRSVVLAISDLPEEIRAKIQGEDMGECDCSCEACKACENRSARKQKDSGPGSNTKCQCTCSQCQVGNCEECSNPDYEGEHDLPEEPDSGRSAALDEIDARLRLAGLRSPKVPDNDGDDDDTACRCRCRACYDSECEECPTHMVSCGDTERCHASERSLMRDGKKTKRVDGEDLTYAAFLWVGDPDKTETWKLPWKFSTEEKTKSHLRNALARFNQTQGIPASEKPKVKAKLIRLCKEHGIHVGEDSD